MTIKYVGYSSSCTGFLTEGYKFLTCAHCIRKLSEANKVLHPFWTPTEIKLYVGLSGNIANKVPNVILTEEDIRKFYIPARYSISNGSHYSHGVVSPYDFAFIDLSRFKDHLPTQHFYIDDFSNVNHEICGKLFIQFFSPDIHFVGDFWYI